MNQQMFVDVTVVSGRSTECIWLMPYVVAFTDAHFSWAQNVWVCFPARLFSSCMPAKWVSFNSITLVYKQLSWIGIFNAINRIYTFFVSWRTRITHATFLYDNFVRFNQMDLQNDDLIEFVFASIAKSSICMLEICVNE